MIQAAADRAVHVARAASCAVVGLCVEDPLSFALTFLALLDAGRTPVVLPTRDECGLLGVSEIVTEQGLAQNQPGVCRLQGVAGGFYAFSSGTTGTRKPLLLQAERTRANACAHAASLGIGQQHRIAQTLRIHHSFGIVAYVFTPLVCGARVQLGTYFDALFSAPQEQLAKTVVHLTPNHVQLLKRRGVQLPGKLGKLSVGAGPLRRDDAIYAQTLCNELYTTYGLSEAGPRVTTGRVRAHEFVDGWIGFPLDGIRSRVDADGVLYVQSPYAVQEDFFSTGDRIDTLPDGSWVFRNRVDDVLRVRGQTYARADYNRKLENLLGLPCEVVQRTHSDELVVFVETAHPCAGAALLVGRAFPELRDARVIPLDAFERTVLGKTDVARLLARVGDL